MFISLYDKNPLQSIAFYYVTTALIIANSSAFLMAVPIGDDAFFLFGMTPAYLFASDGPGLGILSLLTYAFVHAGWMHLLGNMAFLWVFGDNVEDAMGHFKFLILYLLCGIAGGIAHALVNAGEFGPLVGASGAISGVAAAYCVLFPRARIYGIIPLFKLPLWGVPAVLVLSLWIGFQVFAALLGHQISWIDPNISFASHVGGIVVGLALAKAWARKPFLDVTDPPA